ncbi:MAG: flagellar biosynthetic protein FliO [Candidatus Melainabacteria bacterium]
MGMLLTQTTWHYLAAFTVYTVAAVVVMYIIYFAVKRDPVRLARLQAMAGGSAHGAALGQLPPSARVFPETLLAALKHGLKRLDLKTGAAERQTPQPSLVIEEARMLDTLNTVSVLRVGEARYLVASGPQGVSLLTPLDATKPQEG